MQFLLDTGIGLVVFGADCIHINMFSIEDSSGNIFDKYWWEKAPHKKKTSFNIKLQNLA
jgi:hypothetical protein